VYTSGSYADPAWITSLAGNKISGNITGNAANVTGTVAIANGGTGATTAAAARTNVLPSYTGNAGKALVVNGGETDVVWTALSGSGTVTSVAVSGGTTGLTTSGGPVTASGTITLAGTLAVANGGTGATTASAGFNALSPITTVGDLIIGNGVNSATRLAIGTNAQVLTSNGTTASWQTPTTGVTVAADNTWTGIQTFTNSKARLLGSSTGYTTFTSANSSALNYTLTIPAVTDTVAVLGTAQSFTAAQTFAASGVRLLGSSTGFTTFASANASTTNYTLTFPARDDTVVTINSSDTLTNKTISGLANTISNVSLTTAVTGALPVANGGTGQTTAIGGFNALSPITTAGDLIIGNGVNSATRLAIGTSAQVLTSNGTTASWQTPTAPGSGNFGYLNIPQNSQSAAYTLVLADSGKHILHPSADTTARTFTIPANGSVAFPIGTAITFVNQNAAGTITIAITTDTMRLAGSGATGSRTLTANGTATALKITATEWLISGVNLS
jgi:hypothetical protein